MVDTPEALGVPTPIGLDSTRFRLAGTDSLGEANISELRESFRQGFVFELLDLARPNTPLAVHVMVLNPVRYTLTEPFALTLTPAEDDTVVAEENGVVIREITLEGTYGVTEKRARGFIGAQGGGNLLSGTDHFQNLRNVFRKYSQLKQDPQRAANIQLIFHALRDDDHFVVTPREFATPRDATRTRVHYEYRITMAAIAEATQSALQRQDIGVGFFDRLSNTLRDINEAFNDVRAGIVDVTAGIANIRRKIGNIDAVVNNAIQVVNAVGGFLSGASRLINYPYQLISSVTNQIDRAAEDLALSVENNDFGPFDEHVRSLFQISNGIDRIAQSPERFQADASRVEDFFEGERAITTGDISESETPLVGTPGPGGATQGTRTRAVAGSAGQLAGLSIPRGTGLQGIVVSRTDSIEGLATRSGTTPEAIVLLNELKPPYITSAGGPGIAKPGDVLLVPADTGGPSGEPRGANDYLSSEEALYGVDLALDPVELANGRFELLVNETSDPEDADHSRGVGNVAQGTEITIGTEIGTTAFLPEVGIRRNVGSKGTTQHVLLASITLREALLQDDRISGIDSSRVVFDGRTGELTQEITPVVSGTRPGATLVLPFGRASGGDG